MFIEVPVTKVTRSPKHMTFFFLFVCYSFVMNVVFQAYVISFLVNPGLNKPVSTFYELIESNLIYAEETSIEYFLHVTSYSEQ